VTAHDCPANGCMRRVAAHMLMCRPHWYMVLAPLRSDVWNAWADGAGAGTAEHWRAIIAAVRAVNEKLAAKSGPTGRGSRIIICANCRRRLHRQRDGSWYHAHNASVSCRPGEGSQWRAEPISIEAQP
jgi:hypothetical protein